MEQFLGSLLFVFVGAAFVFHFMGVMGRWTADFFYTWALERGVCGWLLVMILFLIRCKYNNFV